MQSRKSLLQASGALQKKNSLRGKQSSSNTRTYIYCSGVPVCISKNHDAHFAVRARPFKCLGESWAEAFDVQDVGDRLYVCVFCLLASVSANVTFVLLCWF